ncbi:dihydroorotase [Candidatus Omnitrophota bacterium]
MKILIKNAHCVDPRALLNEIKDVLIVDGSIKEIKEDITVKADEVIDARGLHLFPGLIDVHVHFREPGHEHKETIATGIDAALHGGFTACVTMPNTKPCCDSSSVTEFILNEGKKKGFSIFPCGTMTKGREGKELSEMADMKRAGIVAASDDGGPISTSILMRRIMEYASMLNIPLMLHEEDSTLSQNTVMHEGAMSTQLGLKGMPSLGEYLMVMRDIELARLTGARVHFQHISCKESVALIKAAKKEGLKITCEVTPHHLALIDEELVSYDTTFKVSPPLREKKDKDALQKGVKDGVIDMIATDHAPHHSVEKENDINHAPFGCIGLESALGVTLTELFHTKMLDLTKVVELMNVNPAALIGQYDHGALKVGNEANCALVDVDKEWIVDATTFKSKARNCPFNKRTLKGKAVTTICKGVVYNND